jgi:hypothetical protein
LQKIQQKALNNAYLLVQQKERGPLQQKTKKKMPKKIYVISLTKAGSRVKKIKGTEAL